MSNTKEDKTPVVDEKTTTTVETKPAVGSDMTTEDQAKNDQETKMTQDGPVILTTEKPVEGEEKKTNEGPALTPPIQPAEPVKDPEDGERGLETFPKETLKDDPENLDAEDFGEFVNDLEEDDVVQLPEAKEKADEGYTLPDRSGTIRNKDGGVAYAPPGSMNAAMNGVQEDASGHISSAGTYNSDKSGTRV